MVSREEVSSLPLSTQASAPVVTKLEKRLRLLPPRSDCRKFGNEIQSPVAFGVRGGGVFRGEVRGVLSSSSMTVRCREWFENVDGDDLNSAVYWF